jgi:hypothetical protein
MVWNRHPAWPGPGFQCEFLTVPLSVPKPAQKDSVAFGIVDAQVAVMLSPILMLCDKLCELWFDS